MIEDNFGTIPAALIQYRGGGLFFLVRPGALEMSRDQRYLEEMPLPREVGQRLRELRVRGRPAPDPKRVRRVLVRAPNWLGDAVMSLPLLSALRGFYPQASITVLAVPRVAPLYYHHPTVSRLIPYPGTQDRRRLLWGLRKNYDLALALPNSLESALGLWLAGAPHRVGYNADARRFFLTRAVSGQENLKGLHTVFYFLGILRGLGEVSRFTPPALYLETPELAGADALLAAAPGGGPGPWVGLAPGAAYGPAKRWPPARFAALAGELHRLLQARLLLLGGPEDRPVAAQVQEHFRFPVLDLTGKTNLRQALGVLRRLDLLVTNDSGLMHAAAALGVPLVAIFGSTDPAATGPFTSRASVLHHPLPCSPCFLRTCPEDYPCLTAITVDQVMATARGWLEETP
jgi:heptosyltransferase-2